MKARRSRRRTILLVLVLALFVAPAASASAGEQANRIGGQIFDVLILRPAGLAQYLVGSALFIPSYPFSIAAGNADSVLDRCITEPAHFTFKRELGEF